MTMDAKRAAALQRSWVPNHTTSTIVPRSRVTTSPQSPSISSPEQRRTPRKSTRTALTTPSPQSRAPTTPTGRRSSPSPSPLSNGTESPTRERSPSPRARSYGADNYSVEYLKKQSLQLDTATKDPSTKIISQIPDCDARCTLWVNGLVWVGERDGSITIRNPGDGSVVHVIERKRGVFVWTMLQVGGNVWAGCSDGFFRILSASTYEVVHQFGRHQGGGGGVQVLALHAPTMTIFSGGNDFELLSWDANTYEFKQRYSGHSAAVRSIVASGNTVWSGSDDHTIFVWDAINGEHIGTLTGHTGGVHALCLSDDHLWSGSEDGTIRVWDRVKGECVAVGQCHTGAVECLVPIGEKMWSAAGDTVCVWDCNQLKLLGTYVAHEGYVSSIVVASETSQYVVWTTASDGKIQVWQSEGPPSDQGARKGAQALQELEQENQRLRLAHKKQLENLEQVNEKKIEECQRLSSENHSLETRLNKLQSLTSSLGVSVSDGQIGRARPESGPPPSGRVALVFTDVQSSTELWEKHTEDMEKGLEMHNEIMRDGIQRYNGYEVKTEGDAFMVAFHSAIDATRWCLDMQIRLLNHSEWPIGLMSHPSAREEIGKNGSVIWKGLRVRMGVHVGEPAGKRDPASGRMDYFGRMVNKAARIGGLGKGGQIVVSDDVLTDLQHQGSLDVLLEGASIIDLGERKLKGISEPCHVFSLAHSKLVERKFLDAEAIETPLMDVSEDGKVGKGNKGREAAHYMFVNRLKKRVDEMPSDLDTLRRELFAREEELRTVTTKLNESAESNRQLQIRANSLQNENDQLHERTEKIQTELVHLERGYKVMQDSRSQLEHELTTIRQEMTVRIAALEQSNHDAIAIKAKLEAELLTAQTDVDRLSCRLRDVDLVLQSRLRLLTDVFALYKKADILYKKCRKGPLDADGLSLIAEFRAAISRHYSDDELAHLGSSRHFFPVVRIESPSIRATSPTRMA